MALKFEPLDKQRGRVEVVNIACPDGDDVCVPVDPDIATFGVDVGNGLFVELEVPGFAAGLECRWHWCRREDMHGRID